MSNFMGAFRRLTRLFREETSEERGRLQSIQNRVYFAVTVHEWKSKYQPEGVNRAHTYQILCKMFVEMGDWKWVE